MQFSSEDQWLDLGILGVREFQVGIVSMLGPSWRSSSSTRKEGMEGLGNAVGVTLL